MTLPARGAQDARLSIISTARSALAHSQEITTLLFTHRRSTEGPTSSYQHPHSRTPTHASTHPPTLQPTHPRTHSRPPSPRYVSQDACSSAPRPSHLFVFTPLHSQYAFRVKGYGSARVHRLAHSLPRCNPPTSFLPACCLRSWQILKGVGATPSTPACCPGPVFTPPHSQYAFRVEGYGSRAAGQPGSTD